MSSTDESRTLGIVLAACQVVAALAVIFIPAARNGVGLAFFFATHVLAPAAVFVGPNRHAVRKSFGQIYAQVRNGGLGTPPWQVLPAALSLIAIFVLMFADASH